MKFTTTRVAVITAIVILVAAGVLFLLIKNGSVVIVTKEKAISLIKEKYPDLQSYPSNDLPPRAITAEHDKQGWHVAFIIEGSGLPILGAQCFLVNRDKTVVKTGDYRPTSIDNQTEISPKTCQ